MENKNDSRAKDLLRKHDQLKSTRLPFEKNWREIRDRIAPWTSDFSVENQPGQLKTNLMHDSTAPLALERGTAAVMSLITPSNTRWHGFSLDDEEIDERRNVRVYCDNLTKVAFGARYRPSANFASQIMEVYGSLLLFGTGCIFTDEYLGTNARQHGLIYKSIALAELYIAENAWGRIDTVHREYKYSARQCAQRFGHENLTDKMKQSLEKGTDDKFIILHCVSPNEEQIYGRKDYKGWDIYSCHIAVDGQTVLREGGYRTMPYAVSRYTTNPRDEYGRSPALMALADIKQVNEMEYTLLRAAHRIAEPVLLAAGDGVLSRFNMRPGHVNPGALDDMGRRLVDQLEFKGQLPWAFEMAEAKRKVINDSFLVTLFQILVDSPTMTATEALLRAQEKGALLAPVVGRQENELLGPIIERELDLLARAGQLPPDMPEEIIEAGGRISIKYTGPHSKMQRAQDGIAVARTLEVLAPLMQLDPKAGQILNKAEAFKILADANGLPAKALYSDEQLAEQDAQEQQMADLQNVIAAAPVAAQSAKALMEAQALASQSPSVGSVL